MPIYTVMSAEENYKCKILFLIGNANIEHLDASISAMGITVTHVIQYLICTQPQFIKIGYGNYL